MKMIVCRDYAQMSRRAALHVVTAIANNPTAVLGFPTGDTPRGMYRELINLYNDCGLDFSGITVFNLDEYAGLAPNDPGSYRGYMLENLFRHVNIPVESTFCPDSLCEDAELECRRYEKLISESGGIDLMVLGIGVNGHIGFNEPGNDFIDCTHLVELAPETIAANSRFFPSMDMVPRRALSVGIGTIMRSRAILILASGAAKAEAVQKALQGPVTPGHPASILKMHPDVSWVLAEGAESKLIQHQPGRS